MTPDEPPPIDLVEAYSCDAVVETGCFLGDTTVYFARRYSLLPVHSCDIEPGHAAFTRRRLAEYSNATIECRDSPGLVVEATARYERPLFFLDAHWGERWPLPEELQAVGRGLVAIHDFDVGHPRFSFDTYQGVVCGPDLIRQLPDLPGRYYVPNPEADYPLPCLQVGRRSGVGIVAIGLDDTQLTQNPRLLARSLSNTAVVTG